MWPPVDMTTICSKDWVFSVLFFGPGHSYPINIFSLFYRIGGASALAAAGIPDTTIQGFGSVARLDV